MLLKSFWLVVTVVMKRTNGGGRGKDSLLCNFHKVPYFFGYKTGFFSFQNNPKVLDPSCKTDLELWHCLGRVELVL